MTPAERIRLAEALTAATAQPWRVSGLVGHGPDPAADGATREGRPRVSVYRVGDVGWLDTLLAENFRIGHGWERWEFTRQTFPAATGRGWFPRFVAQAVEAVRAFDAEANVRALSTRDRRRADVYERYLHPNSGACESERVQALRHLKRMGRR